MTLVLHDTATGTLRPLETREPGIVSMYVCGPTVYAPPHLGHGRFALVFDVLRRYLTWNGHSVVYCSNITDVDDKIIRRAQQEGRSEFEVAEEFETVWFATMDRLGVQRPTYAPHATKYIPHMVAMIGELIDRNVAYETADGVYLAVDTVPGYGLLAQQPLDELRVGARVAVDEAKRSPLDFVLWKKVASDAGIVWPSPWGSGRPGWHTECVVMSLDLLGAGFDLHGGGLDLKFPHHENERAQAVALGQMFARHWLHNGFVEVDGKKMGKSENNAMSLGDLLERHDPRSYRLLVLQSHYRSPLQVTSQTVAEADRSLERLDTYLRRATDLPAAEPAPQVIEQFRRRMDNDLDTAGAMAVAFAAMREVNSRLDRLLDRDAAPLHAAVAEILSAVGLKPPETSKEQHRVPLDIQSLLNERCRARETKDWSLADELRDQIERLGWVVNDTASGQIVEPLGRA